MNSSIQFRLENRTDKRGPILNRHLGRCWLWTGATDGPQGYSRIRIGNGKRIGVHVLAYTLANGPIPEARDIHHRCENPKCVRPAHLIALTRKEHIALGNAPTGKNARKSRCLRGHRLSGRNLLRVRNGRACKECQRQRSRAWRIKQFPAAKFAALIEALRKAAK